MNKVHLFKEQKAKLFNQKQAENLSQLSRSQLRKLDEAGLVVPLKYPAILYNWNQVIFLRVLYCLREDWSFMQIEKALRECEFSIEEIIGNINKYLFVALGKKADGKFAFVFMNESIFGDDLLGRKARKLFSTESELFLENLKKIDNDSVIMTNSKRKVNDFTSIAIPQIINEIKERAEELQIDNFHLKVG